MVLAPLPSPPPSRPPLTKKRLRSWTSAPDDDHLTTPKRRRPTEAQTRSPDSAQDEYTRRLAFWVQQQEWPRDEPTHKMSSRKRDASRSSSASSHWSDRYRALARFNIYHEEDPPPQSSSLDLCQQLFHERFDQVAYSNVPTDRFRDASYRAQLLNETRIQRDITPWVLPSPELLTLWEVPGLQDLAEELNAEWYRCSTMGWTCPKPDVAVGFRPSAFSDDEQRRLNAYATSERPVFFTPNLAFAFLVGEAKSGQKGLDEGDGQNLHSAAIAVRAVFQLYERAWGWGSPRMMEDLDGQVLVFSISHDADRVHLYGHFAVCERATCVAELQYRRHPLRLLSLKAGRGEQRLVSYNFVRNVYETFARLQLNRLRAAIAQLVLPRTQSLAPSDSSGGDVDGDEISDGDPESSRGRKQIRRQPSSAQTVTTRTQMTQLMARIAQYEEDAVRHRQASASQLAQQREDSAKQLVQLEKQLIQQREDSAKQLAQQREDSDRQMTELRRIIGLLGDTAKR